MKYSSMIPLQRLTLVGRRDNSFLIALAVASAITLAAPESALGQPALSRIFRDVTVTSNDAGHRVTVGFERPLRYLRHSPANKGRVLRIEFESLELAGSPTFEELPQRESVAPPRPIVSLVQRLLWESTDLGGALPGKSGSIEFRFRSTLAYQVEPGADSRSITVLLVRPKVPARKTSDLQSTRLLEARRAIRDGEGERALLLLGKLVDDDKSDTETQQESRELLGVVHERRGELAHARAEYEAFLARWPEAEGAKRVRQRLESMLEASTPGRSALRERSEDPSAGRPEYFGSAAVSYSRTETLDDANGGSVDNSSGIADLYATSRLRTEELSLRGDVLANYRYDFQNSQSGDDTRISRLMLTAGDANENLKATIGRQSRSNGGVLGRFDGAQLSWRLSDRITISGVGGFPLQSTSALKIQTDEWMLGAAVDFARIFFDLQGQLFVVGQKDQGFTDRFAIGGELRYAKPGRFGLLFLDYDVYFQSLNTALLTGNVTIGPNTNVNVLLETRNSQPVTLGNALIGQTGTEDLRALRLIFSESQMKDLAADRTSRSYTGSLALTHRIDATLQLAGDVTISSYSSTPSSGGAFGTPSQGPDVGVGLQVTKTDFPMSNSFTAASIRHFNSKTSDITSLQASVRVPLLEKLRLMARVRTDYRDVQSAALSDQITLRPSLRLDWRIHQFVVDAELGLNWTNGLGGSSAFDSTGYFAELVLRWDFE